MILVMDMLSLALLGWESLDKVKAIHSLLEAWALLFFVVLVVSDVISHLGENEASRFSKRVGFWRMLALVSFALAIVLEICAFPYGQRNDELSTTRIAALDRDAAASRVAAKHFELEIEQARAQAAQANGKIAAAMARSSKAHALAAQLNEGR